MMKKTDSLTFDTDIYNTIRRNIRKYRQESGLTAAELAELVGRSHDFIRQIESEKVGYNFSVETFYKISERERPDGLLSIAYLPRYKIEDFKVKEKSIILVLDGIEIPGNIGTMLRACDGAGVEAVFICNRRARLTHPKLIKGSMGAVLTIPMYEFEDVASCYKFLEDNNYTIFLADTRAKNTYFTQKYPSHTAFVMGNERHGISREWYTYPVEMISIPMLGKCDSLNVGVSATILIYDASMKHGC